MGPALGCAFDYAAEAAAMSDDNIQSVLLEHRKFPPSKAFVAKARLDAERLAQLKPEAEKDFVSFWARLAREELAWHKPFSKTFDDSKAPNYRWFTDGTLNVSDRKSTRLNSSHV